MKSFLTKASYILYSYLTVVFFQVLFFNKPGTIEFQPTIMISIFLLGLFLVTFCAKFLSEKLRKLDLILSDKHRKQLFFLGVIILYIIQLFFVYQFYGRTGFDSDYVYTSSMGLQHPDFGPEYFSIYPNNFFILFFERFIFKIHTSLNLPIDYYWVLVMINIASIDISLYLIYKIVGKVADKDASVYALFLGVLLLGFMPWLTSVYSDTLSLPITLLIYYFYLKLKETNKCRTKILYIFGMGILVQAGFLIKPSTVIVFIAIVFIELLTYQFRKISIQSLKNGVIIALALFIGVISVKLPYQYKVNNQQFVDYDESLNFPFTHWMMMGMKKSDYNGNAAYGFWTIEDFLMTINIEGKEEKIDAHVEEMQQRLKEFGIIGYATFMWEKSVWILGDGTFFWGDEGVRDLVTGEKGLKQAIQEIVYPSGKYYNHYVYTLQTIWLITFLFFVLMLFYIKKYAKKDIYIISCTILGSILFVLLFEGRSRYLMNNLGFVVIIAGIVMREISNKIKLPSLSVRRTVNNIDVKQIEIKDGGM